MAQEVLTTQDKLIKLTHEIIEDIAKQDPDGRATSEIEEQIISHGLYFGYCVYVYNKDKKVYYPLKYISDVKMRKIANKYMKASDFEQLMDALTTLMNNEVKEVETKKATRLEAKKKETEETFQYFSSNVRYFLKISNLKNGELANLVSNTGASIGGSAISNYLSGERTPELPTVQKFANCLGLDVEMLCQVDFENAELDKIVDELTEKKIRSLFPTKRSEKAVQNSRFCVAYYVYKKWLWNEEKLQEVMSNLDDAKKEELFNQLLLLCKSGFLCAWHDNINDGLINYLSVLFYEWLVKYCSLAEKFGDYKEGDKSYRSQILMNGSPRFWQEYQIARREFLNEHDDEMDEIIVKIKELGYVDLAYYYHALRYLYRLHYTEDLADETEIQKGLSSRTISKLKRMEIDGAEMLHSFSMINNKYAKKYVDIFNLPYNT